MKTFEDFVRILSEYVRRIGLDPAVRDSVRERLSAYADMHAISGVLPSPSRFSILSPLNLRVFQTGFALLLIAASMGGVAYASSDALPGDRLYAVKTGVVEPLESALLYDAESRATWNAILAERRLKEAATLATDGKLDEAVRADLEERFVLHAERSNSAAKEVETEDAAVALKIHSDLEARLSAHVDLFSYIASDETRPEAQKMLARIAEKRDTVSAKRQEIEAKVIERSLAYGDRQIEEAERTTDEVARMAKIEGAAGGTIDARITAAREALQSARASNARGEGGIAYVATQVATRLTHEASILAKNRGILALAPEPDASAAASVEAPPAPASKAKEKPRTPQARPTDSVILLKLPVLDTEDDAATSTEEEEDKKDEKDQPKKGAQEDDDDNSRADDSSQDSQDDEDSSNDTTSSSGSDSGTVRNVIRSVLSPLGL